MFSYFNPSLITDAGRNKLKNVLNKLTTLQSKMLTEAPFVTDAKSRSKQQGYQRSEHSRKMVANTIKIVSLILEDSSMGLTSKSNEILNLVSFLDDNKNTYIPEIYNQESKELAEIIFEVVNNFSIKDDFTSAARGLMTSVDPEKILTTMKVNLGHRLRMYKVFETNMQDYEKMQNILQTIMAINEKLDDSNQVLDEEFVEKYEIGCENIIKQVQTLPYVRILNAGSFTNKSEPYQLLSSEVETAGNRGNCIVQLISMESFLNQKLISQGMPTVHTAYDFYISRYSNLKSSELTSKYLKIVEDLGKQIDSFVHGAHFTGFFGSFKTVDPDKVVAAQFMLQNIKLLEKELERDPLGFVAIKAFKFTLDATMENQRICKDKNISLGQLSTITTDVGLALFAISFFETDETTDKGIQKRLTRYMEDETAAKNEFDFLTQATPKIRA